MHSLWDDTFPPAAQATAPSHQKWDHAQPPQHELVIRCKLRHHSNETLQHLLSFPITSNGEKFVITDSNAATVLHPGSRHLSTVSDQTGSGCNLCPLHPGAGTCGQELGGVAGAAWSTKNVYNTCNNVTYSDDSYPPNTKTPDARLTTLLYSRFFSMLECSFQLWWRSGSKDKVMKTRHLVLRIKIQARSKILASQALPTTNQHLAWKSWSVATQAWIVKLSANLTFLSFDPFNGWRKKSWIQQNLCSIIWLISTSDLAVSGENCKMTLERRRQRRRFTRWKPDWFDWRELAGVAIAANKQTYRWVRCDEVILEPFIFNIFQAHI